MRDEPCRNKLAAEFPAFLHLELSTLSIPSLASKYFLKSYRLTLSDQFKPFPEIFENFFHPETMIHDEWWGKTNQTVDKSVYWAQRECNNARTGHFCLVVERSNGESWRRSAREEMETAGWTGRYYVELEGAEPERGMKLLPRETADPPSSWSLAIASPPPHFDRGEGVGWGLCVVSSRSTSHEDAGRERKMMMPEEYPLSKRKEQTDRKTRPLSSRTHSIELALESKKCEWKLKKIHKSQVNEFRCMAGKSFTWLVRSY